MARNNNNEFVTSICELIIDAPILGANNPTKYSDLASLYIASISKEITSLLTQELINRSFSHQLTTSKQPQPTQAG